MNNVKRYKIGRVETEVEERMDDRTRLHVWTPFGLVVVVSYEKPRFSWSLYQFMWEGYRYQWSEGRARTITGLATVAHKFARYVAGRGVASPSLDMFKGEA